MIFASIVFFNNKWNESIRFRNEVTETTEHSVYSLIFYKDPATRRQIITVNKLLFLLSSKGTTEEIRTKSSPVQTEFQRLLHRTQSLEFLLRTRIPSSVNKYNLRLCVISKRKHNIHVRIAKPLLYVYRTQFQDKKQYGSHLSIYSGPLIVTFRFQYANQIARSACLIRAGEIRLVNKIKRAS